MHSIPDVAAPLARTCFSSNSKELAGYPFAVANTVAVSYCGLASFVFLCHSSQLGSFYDPEELKDRSCTFPGQSKKHHATHTNMAYAPSNTITNTTSSLSQTALPLSCWYTSANKLTLHYGVWAHSSASASSPPWARAYTTLRWIYSLITSIPCRLGLVSVRYY